MAPIPVILDTDIGDDIDDAWALAYLLSHPGCDLRLVVTAYGDRERHLTRARIARKFLRLAGRSDVPVALGLPSWGREGSSRPDCGQQRWAADEGGGADSAPEEDGIGAMARVIQGSEEPITILSIGPLCNVAALLDRAGDGVVGKVRLVGMQGSVFRGYSGRAPAVAEHNVACDPAACARAFAAPWVSAPVIAPLDSCMPVQLRGALLQRLHAADAPVLTRGLLEAYGCWLQDSRVANKYWAGTDPKEESTVLFDALAAYLALHPDGGGLLEMRPVRLRVAEDGRTLAEDETSNPEVVCAVDWRDGGLEGFLAHLTDALLGAAGDARL